MDISGKAALVTGASRGLGEALAVELGLRGAKVVLVGRSRQSLEPVVRRIVEQRGEAYALEADMGAKTDMYPLAGAATALVGPIDILIHNASELGPTPLRLLLDTECEDLERVLAVNLLGPFRLSKIIAGSMALRRQGTIVHVSSDASVSAYERWGAYSVSKAALDHLARLWAAELAGHGVRSFSVDPGEMDTEMHAAALPEADRALLARPVDVARAIVQLVSADATPNGGRLEASGIGAES
ncbi:MAG TPA: SDR family oxidoreductase [Polyangiaceae bacterium]|jgi:NAD(P)-dependent dehydrogenase (short-subunit alcohol dehydrogenase family)|nr:SDR family oxidoreductase [Polyangiaceae bacterium]